MSEYSKEDWLQLIALAFILITFAGAVVYAITQMEAPAHRAYLGVTK